MNKLNSKKWFFVIILMLAGCDDDNNSGKTGSGATTPPRPPIVRFTSDYPFNRYGVDLALGHETTNYISVRVSNNAMIYKTGFNISISNMPDGAMVSTRNNIRTIILNGNETHTGIYMASGTLPIEFHSTSEGHHMIDVHGCTRATTTGEPDCNIRVASMEVLTYSERVLMGPTIYYYYSYRNDAAADVVRRNSENRINDFLNHAVCAVRNTRAVQLPLSYTQDVWDLNGNGTLDYREDYKDELEALMVWAYNEGIWREGWPTIINLPNEIICENTMRCTGMAYRDLAVVGNDATPRDMVHEYLHLGSSADLRDVIDDNHMFNIMYYSSFTEGHRTCYRSLRTTGGFQSQWARMRGGR